MFSQHGQLILSYVPWVIKMKYLFIISEWAEIWATLACGTNE